MKRELDQLLAQRSHYAQAERASTTVKQQVQHTGQRLRLDQEIGGRREALAALDEPPRARARSLSEPRLARLPVLAAGTAATSSRRRPTMLLTLGVCAATFALGFVLIGDMLSRDATSSAAPAVQRVRYHRLTPAAPIRVHQARSTPVMARGAEPTPSHSK